MTIERYTIPGAYSLATGERLPSETFEREDIGHARRKLRGAASHDRRMALYWDLTPWGAGFIRTNAPPCAIIIGHAAGLMFDPACGLVYRDSRFATVKGQ